MVFRGKVIEIQAFLKKQEKKNPKQPNLPPKRIRKRTNTTYSQKKELIKIRKEIRDFFKKKKKEINKTKSWSFEMVKKLTDLSPDSLRRGEKEIRSEKVKKMSMDTAEIQRSIRDTMNNYISTNSTS